MDPTPTSSLGTDPAMHAHQCEQAAPPFLLYGVNEKGDDILIRANNGQTTKDFVVGFNGVPVARLNLIAIATSKHGNVTQTLGSWLAN